MAATRIKSGTTTADAVTTVTFPVWYAAVEVTNRDTANTLTATLGTATVTSLGDDMEVIPPGKSVVIPNPQPEPEPGAGITGGDTDVQLIAEATKTAAYTVKGL